MSIFDDKNIKPMLIGEMQEPFDNPNYIYELKLDGERCIAYLDKNGTELRNKRNMRMNPKVPELTKIHNQASVRCILDGELIVLKDGRPDFFEIQRRSLMSNAFKIKLAADKYPASFTAFDILFYKDKQTTDLLLMERKELLQKTVQENERLAISRYIKERGIDLYNLTVQQDLEGIVAKRRDSKYFMDKRTKDWIKIKNLKDEDFVICGYIEKENNVVSLILGAFEDGQLINQGHVTLGISSQDFAAIRAMDCSAPLFEEDRRTVWVKPALVCTVKYMMLTKGGGMRQPVFKGLRDDKSPQECVRK